MEDTSMPMGDPPLWGGILPNYTYTYTRTWGGDGANTPPPLAPEPKQRIGRKHARRVAKARINRIARRLLRD